VDLRQLRYFVAVAEELHFTRAAERLHLAQSALSAQIRGLEKEIGAPLFVRSTRRVSLTPVGETLLDDARDVLDRADRVLARARALARHEADALAVGCLGAVPGELLTDILRELAALRPQARVDVRTFGFAEIHPSITAARADVAFVYLPYDDEELADLEVVPLRDEQRVVVLAASHRHADRDALSPADLAGERFVSHSPAVSATWRDFWMLTDQLGSRPEIHEHAADDMDDWLHLIARGEAIDTCPTLVSRYYAWPGVRYVPLVGAPPATLALVHRRGVREPLVQAFVEVAVEVAARVSGPLPEPAATPAASRARR